MKSDMREAFEEIYRAGFVDAASMEGVVTQDVDSPVVEVSMKNHVDRVFGQSHKAQGAEAQQVAAEAYQVIGALTHGPLFDSNPVQDALSYFGDIANGTPGVRVKEILPFHPPAPAAVPNMGSDFDRLVYEWFQESTIRHHIEPDGRHIAKRARFIAEKAVIWARQQ